LWLIGDSLGSVQGQYAVFQTLQSSQGDVVLFFGVTEHKNVIVDVGNIEMSAKV